MQYLKFAALFAGLAFVVGVLASVVVLGFTFTFLFAGSIAVTAILGGVGLALYLLAVHILQAAIFTARIYKIGKPNLDKTWISILLARYWFSLVSAPTSLLNTNTGARIYWPSAYGRKAKARHEAESQREPG